MEPLTTVTADSFQLYRTLSSMLARAAIVRIACDGGEEGIEVYDALFPHGYPVEATVTPPLTLHVYTQRAPLADAIAQRHPAILAVHPDRLVVNGIRMDAMVDISRVGESAPTFELAPLVPELQPLPEERRLPVAVLDRPEPPDEG